MRHSAAVLLGALTIIAAATGCSGSSSGAGTPAPTQTSSGVLPTAHTGLAGAIDGARRVALCENVRLARTAYDGGQRAAAAQALDGARTVLRQAPVNPALLLLAQKDEAQQHSRGVEVALRALEAACAA